MQKKTVGEFIEGFVKGTVAENKVHGNWSTYWFGGLVVLKYTSRRVNRYNSTEIESEIVAYRFPDGSVISNANQLRYVERQYAWGSEVHRWSGNQTKTQRMLEDLGATPVAFTLFTESGLDARDFSWVVKPVKENVTVLIKHTRYTPAGTNEVYLEPTTRHFVGACIFAICEEHYLFDVDRQELEHGIFNAFVTKLATRETSIKEAYNSLVPEYVAKCILDGKDVKRQGEFYFIKVSDTYPVKVTLTKEQWEVLKYKPSLYGFRLSTDPTSRDDIKLFPNTTELTPLEREYQEAALRYTTVLNLVSKGISKRGSLGKSASGSHTVEKYLEDAGKIYASGKISQDRREHADIILEGWYEVQANTGTFSWTIIGDID